MQVDINSLDFEETDRTLAAAEHGASLPEVAGCGLSELNSREIMARLGAPASSPDEGFTGSPGEKCRGQKMLTFSYAVACGAARCIDLKSIDHHCANLASVG